jgi:hypothetical protein
MNSMLSMIWYACYWSQSRLLCRYQVLSVMAVGRRSVVLKARKMLRDEQVAIKLFSSEETWRREVDTYEYLKSNSFMPWMEEKGQGSPTSPPFIVLELGLKDLSAWLKTRGTFTEKPQIQLAQVKEVLRQVRGCQGQTDRQTRRGEDMSTRTPSFLAAGLIGASFLLCDSWSIIPLLKEHHSNQSAGLMAQQR